MSAGTRNLAWSKYLLPSESERRLPTLAGTNHTGSSLKGTVRPALGTSLLAVPCCHARGLNQEWEGCVFPKMLVYQLRAFNACMSGVCRSLLLVVSFISCLSSTSTKYL